MNKQILIVDDDESIRIRLNSLLSSNGYDVSTAESASDALKILESQFIPIIISDHRMPEMSGVDFLGIVKTEYPNTVRMVLSEYEDFSAISDAFNNGAIYKYLAKKWSDKELLHNVKSAFVCYEELNKQQAVTNSLSRTIEAVVITNKEGKISSVNDAFTQLTQFTSDEMIGNRPDIFDCDNKRLEEIQTELRNTGCWEGKLHVTNKNNEKIPIFLSITAIKNNMSIVTQVIYYFIDISEKILIEDQLNYEVLHDKLTNLFNRKHFTDQISQTIQKCNDDSMIIVIAIDIERFRNINAILGNEAGDEILKSSAMLLEKIISNTAGVVARVGDDQFALSLSIDKESDYAQELINQINDGFTKPFIINGKPIYIAINIGSSCYPDDSDDAIILLQNAIAAANLAKKIGKKHYIRFRPSLERLSSETSILISDIRSGIKNDEFVFYYQPKVELETNKIVGAEALLRWNHPKHGLLLPRDFLAICEETYLIVDIEREMLYKGCDFLKRVNDVVEEDITISLNISAQEFKCANIYVLLKDIIRKTNLLPHLIELEITESNLIHNLDEIKNYLKKIQDLDVKISLDDFGKGYSSLKYLTVLTFDVAKIDKSFINNIETDPRKQIVFTAMLELCQKIGLKTVVEGIETESQLNFLHDLPCDCIQGFYISKPLPENAFIELVKTGLKPQQ